VPCGGDWSWVAIEEFHWPWFEAGSGSAWQAAEASPGDCALRFVLQFWCVNTWISSHTIRDRVERDCGRRCGLAECSVGVGVTPESGAVGTWEVTEDSGAYGSR
jgi:hypothetical protein